MEKITVSLIKADVGGFPGHSAVHPDVKRGANKELKQANLGGLFVDDHLRHAGDDLQLLMGHHKGVDSDKINGLAWNTFEAATEVAKELKLHGAGQDLLVDAFSGNIRVMGPGIAELEFQERGSEPLVAFMMDKTELGAFNYPIYKIFVDLFNTVGLVVDPTMHDGYIFEVWDIKKKRVFLRTPEELYSLLALIGAKSEYVIKRVFPKEGN